MASTVLGGLNPKVPNTKYEWTFKSTYNSKEQQEWKKNKQNAYHTKHFTLQNTLPFGGGRGKVPIGNVPFEYNRYSWGWFMV